MSVRKLIINADDFGVSAEVNRAVIKGWQDGVLTSASLMVTGDACVEAVELARQHPQVYVRLCDERGDPRPNINVFVNNDHVRARAGLDTPLTTGDVVTILPAVSGG